MGIEEGEYKVSCLAGFGRAEVCTSAVGRVVLTELGKVKCSCCLVEEKWSEKDGEKGKEREREVEKIGVDVEVLKDWLVDKIASAEAA